MRLKLKDVNTELARRGNTALSAMGEAPDECRSKKSGRLALREEMDA
jgi:hypothetical protein